MQYIDEITNNNIAILEQIEESKLTLEYKNTRAYKNKILKSEQWLKNNSEEVISLIEEQEYKKYTEDTVDIKQQVFTPQSLLDEQSLLSTMTIYEKWIYFLFKKDIR